MNQNNNIQQQQQQECKFMFQRVNSSTLIIDQKFPPQLINVISQEEYTTISNTFNNMIKPVTIYFTIPAQVLTFLIVLLTLIFRITRASALCTLGVLIPLFSITFIIFFALLINRIINRIKINSFIKKLNGQFKNRNISFSRPFIRLGFSVHYYGTENNTSTINSPTIVVNERTPLLENV